MSFFDKKYRVRPTIVGNFLVEYREWWNPFWKDADSWHDVPYSSYEDAENAMFDKIKLEIEKKKLLNDAKKMKKSKVYDIGKFKKEFPEEFL